MLVLRDAVPIATGGDASESCSSLRLLLGERSRVPKDGGSSLSPKKIVESFHDSDIGYRLVNLTGKFLIGLAANGGKTLGSARHDFPGLKCQQSGLALSTEKTQPLSPRGHPQSNHHFIACEERNFQYCPKDHHHRASYHMIRLCACTSLKYT